MSRIPWFDVFHKISVGEYFKLATNIRDWFQINFSKQYFTVVHTGSNIKQI